MLTQERLKELLSYDPDTGLFTWLVNRSPAKKGYFAGHLKKDGYIYIGIDKKQYLAHRLVFLYTYGEFPSKQVDHINRIKNDNRLFNLRLVTNQENQHNSSLSKLNKTGVTGVVLHKASGKYQADIKVKNRTVYLGLYETLEEAKKARENAKRIYHPTSPEARALSVL